MWWWWRENNRNVVVEEETNIILWPENLYKSAKFYLAFSVYILLLRSWHDMSWFCSVCEKSFSRKDSMQRHVMSKHRNAGITQFQTVPTVFSQKCQRFRFEHPFTFHDCRDDGVGKNGMGSISITASFRGNLPSPGDNHLVLFAMAVCVYRNAGGHATYWIRRLWSGICILMWTNGVWSCLMIRWLTPVKTSE